jgi:hypothetical protein
MREREARKIARALIRKETEQMPKESILTQYRRYAKGSLRKYVSAGFHITTAIMFPMPSNVKFAIETLGIALPALRVNDQTNFIAQIYGISPDELKLTRGQKVIGRAFASYHYFGIIPVGREKAYARLRRKNLERAMAERILRTERRPVQQPTRR